jgi:hypothetical protein
VNADLANTASSLSNLTLDDCRDLIMVPDDKRIGLSAITARDPAQRHLADHDGAEAGAGRE